MNGATPIHKTRLAPSPTGALHLGNARTFLANYLLARQAGWQIVLRIEDLDGPRIKPGADQQAMDDLKWLGVSWDTGPVYQLNRVAKYRAITSKLVESGDAYPCICTRKEVEFAASAPHAEDGASVYPGTCRDRFKSLEEARDVGKREPAIRFKVPDEIVRFNDQFAGDQQVNPAMTLGDFVIQKADGTPAYQLAVVVDDVEQGITQVVRGDDLLDSVPRQMLLYRALGWTDRIPTYTHLPLIVGTDGRRLAKRHGDTRLSFYREHGVSASRILSLLCKWLMIPVKSDPQSADELIGRFDLGSVSREKIVFGARDDEYLKSPRL